MSAQGKIQASGYVEKIMGKNTVILQRMFAEQDIKYGDFSSSLIPEIERKKVIGVRAPVLKKLAKEYYGTAEGQAFMEKLPHHYHEENVMHGYMINLIKEYDECTARLEKFLPYVDNWAVCDIIKPAALRKHTDRSYFRINEWITSGKTYHVRFGICMLMAFFLEEHFTEESMQLAASAVSDASGVSDEYYVKMAVAWYFATALAKQYESAEMYIRENRLERWTHNKAIQKAIESRRIDNEKKAYLKSLKNRG